ncbi:hypothetical protein [Prauserella cavernicola]|uniref:Uncharacterized protein n=1 Tax=Prauserella cavernicola TaxID=2800127 RepID=A0A934V6A0_9PSEU|nr:hypothetical protein [Prauserella cavernicola]MBK1785980.1 hypothetical protein [Prauserella cavernicola]
MEVWRTPKQSWPAALIGMLIRWRAEIALTAATVVTLVWFQSETSTVVMWLTVGGTVAFVAVVPPARRFVLARFWCVVDRHRLRTCLRMAKVRTMNLDGSLPFMLWARPTKTGERVWMWTRAGSSAEELEHVLGSIAPACFARSARLHRVRSLSTLVAVEIVRRDPLDKPQPIASPLARLSARMRGQQATPEGVEPISAATVTPLPIRKNTGTTAKPAKAAKKSTPDAARPSVVVNGEDLSDYID